MLKTCNKWFVVLLMSIISFTSVCYGRWAETLYGRLKIEGGHVESLILRNTNTSDTIDFQEPFEAKQVPIGEYRLQSVKVKGGYSLGAGNYVTVTVEKDKTSIFEIGAPFKHAIEVQRQGKVLVLTYKLIGLAGENYISSTLGNPPGFSIIKGNKEIALGKFEYG